jgi:hypothetical protein
LRLSAADGCGAKGTMLDLEEIGWGRRKTLDLEETGREGG